MKNKKSNRMEFRGSRLSVSRIYFVISLYAISISPSCSQLFDNADGPFNFIPQQFTHMDTVAPYIIASWPMQDTPYVDPASAITVAFSKGMNHELTESSFTLTGGVSTLDGAFIWLNNTMIFSPRQSLNQPGVYNYRLSSSLAESTDGINLLDDYIVQFNHNADIDSPLLVSTDPVNGATGIGVNTHFTVNFSEPMNTGSVLGEITSSPVMNWNIPATIISGDRKTFEFIPTAALANGTSYSVSIPNTIKDQAGNSLLESYTITFIVGSDFVGPELTSISTASVANFVGSEYSVLSGFEKNESITLEFDEPVQASTLLTGVTFSPSATFTVTDISGTGTRYSITPVSNLTIDGIYEIKVTTGVKDLQGNALRRTYTYYAKINGARSRFIQIRNIYTTFAGPSTFGGPLATDQIDTTTMACMDIFANNGAGICDFTPLYFHFCWGSTVATCTFPVSGGGTIVLSSLQINVSKEFGPTESSVPFFSPFANATPLIYAPDEFVFSAQLNDTTQIVTYKITVKGGTSGVLDTNGNYMKTDYIVHFRF